MRVETSTALPGDIDADLVAFAISDRTVTPPVAAEVFAPLAASGELGIRPGEVTLLNLESGKRVAAAGVGSEPTADTLRTAAAAVARRASAFGGTLAWQLDDSLAVPLDVQARAVVEGIVIGGYDPGRWKSKPSERKPVEAITLLGGGDGTAATAADANVVSAWVNRARDLANTPPNQLTPASLAERAVEIAGGHEGLSAEVLGRAEAEQLGMGSFLAVGRGSVNEPKMIVMRWEPAGATAGGGDGILLGLVGKAITFDSGGYSIKPAASMEDMKGDMAGGGAVIASMGALAELGIPVRTIAVVASAENLVDADAFRPGDILTAANGKTIEVTNTDAEGRLVLADALWLARERGATHVIDLATLTGAMELALGDLYAGFFSNDDAWRDRILAASAASGDHAWPFPLHPRYRRYVDSTYADMKNSSVLRQGSPVLAAEFLREFAGEGPWAHVDMAGPGFLERTRGDYLTVPGGTGYGVRLIVELARSLAR